MKKKTVFKRIIGIVLLLVVLFAFVFVMEEYVTKREGNEPLRLRAFYLEPRNSLDVVAMGSSEIQFGYAAPEVYRTTGIVSYPFAFSVNPAPLWKYELAEIQRTQSPKVLMVDINGCIYKDDENIHSKAALYRLLEGIPLSINKLRLIRDMEKDHPLECVFPIIKYHGNWTRFSMDDAKDWRMIKEEGYAPIRGTRARLYRKKLPDGGIHEADSKTAALHPDGEKALREFLEECRKSDIENILFINYPHVLAGDDGYERQKRCNTAAGIIREAGFDYLDLLSQVDLDPELDFFDTDHVSATGQRKVSQYLGKYLQEKYDLEPTAISGKDREGWETSAGYIDRVYRYYDEYTAARKNNPYEKVSTLLRDDRHTLELLDEVKPGPEGAAGSEGPEK